MISFGVLLFAGLNFLFRGLFNFDLFKIIFGESVTARVLYSIFGIATLLLMTIIICKAFVPRKEVRKIEHKIDNVMEAFGSKPATSTSTAKK